MNRVAVAVVLSLIGISSASASGFFNKVGEVFKPNIVMQHQLDAINKQIEQAAKNVPAKEQPSMKAVIDEINSFSVDRLFEVASLPDVCALPTGMNCHGFKSAEVKPALDKAIDRQKIVNDQRIADRTFYTSATSGAISFLSLIISFFALSQKRRMDTVAEPVAPPLNPYQG
jgi:hypothetical protein